MQHLQTFLKALLAFADSPAFKLFLGVVAVGSLYLAFRQWSLRKADERRRNTEDERRQEEEQQPPVVNNMSGREGPILIGGFDETPTAARYWGNVTIINPTSRPMKIGALKLVMDGVETDLKNEVFQFCQMPNSYYERIALRAHDKADYQLVFRFPQGSKLWGAGELWLRSDNRLDGFAVPVDFRRS
jgi:hypothetical protein